MRQYATLRKLRNGETVEIEGAAFVATLDQRLREGDFYIAERITGPYLLTVKELRPVEGFVIPNEGPYFYDYPECVRVEMVES